MNHFQVSDEVTPDELEQSLRTLVRWIVSAHRKRLSGPRSMPGLARRTSAMYLSASSSAGQNRLLNVDGLASYLSIPKATIYSWVSMRKIPEKALVRLNRSLKFDLREIDAWLESSRSGS